MLRCCRKLALVCCGSPHGIAAHTGHTCAISHTPDKWLQVWISNDCRYQVQRITDLTSLKPCQSEDSIVHRPLVSIQFSLVLLPPSSSAVPEGCYPHFTVQISFPSISWSSSSSATAALQCSLFLAMLSHFFSTCRIEYLFHQKLTWSSFTVLSNK